MWVASRLPAREFNAAVVRPSGGPDVVILPQQQARIELVGFSVMRTGTALGTMSLQIGATPIAIWIAAAANGSPVVNWYCNVPIVGDLRLGNLVLNFTALGEMSCTLTGVLIPL